MRSLIALLTLLNSLVFTANAFAQNAEDGAPVETEKTFGNYLVLYNAIPSTTLQPAVAADYKIERGSDIAFINIAVRNRANGGDAAQAATIKGTYTDLIRTEPLEFREIREQNAIYYIAQVRYNNRETLRFDVQIQPQLKSGEAVPVGSPYKISFTRKFFTEK